MIFISGDDVNDISLLEGDLIILTEPAAGREIKSLIMTGKNDRTGHKGQMRTDHIYILPTLVKPLEDVLVNNVLIISSVLTK